MPNAPLDQVYVAMNAAKMRLNDILPTLLPLNRGILQTNMDFTQQGVNNAWTKLRQYVANKGLTKTKQEVVLSPIPVISSTVQNDPSVQVWIDWTGYFNGVSLNTGIFLPQDLIQPLKCWERQTGSLGLFVDPGMEYILDGLPMVPHSNFNLRWEWRNNKLYMPGAIQQTDLRLRYLRYDGSFIDQTTPSVIRWFQQPIPIVDCIDSFSLYIAAEFCASRGQYEVAQGFQVQAENSAKLLVNRDVQMKQRVQARRRSTSGRLEGSVYGNGNGYGY